MSEEDRELPEGAYWQFYDEWEAFPLNKLHADKDVLAEVMIGLSSEEGGTHGEFQLRWLDLGGRSVAELKVFEDGWEALRLSGLVELLAPYDGTYPTPETIKDLLRAHGFKDRTKELAGHGALIICPTCEGKGYTLPKREGALS